MAQRTWSDQEILDALKAWTDKHGRPPTWADWQYAADDRPTSMTVWVRCGSWPDALVLAGLDGEGTQSKRKFSRPEARLMRKRGLSDSAIGKALGVDGSAIGKALGPRATPNPVRRKKLKNRTRAERLADLRAALEKQRKENSGNA